MALLLAHGVGPVLARRLKRAHGSYAAAVRDVVAGAPPATGVRPGVAAALRNEVAGRRWAGEFERVRRAGARFALPGDADYPVLLGEIADPPVGIFVSGEALGPLAPMVAIVGSRTPTPRGSAVAGELAADLSRAGLTVVSGLARGVDTRAHEGALVSGGRTVAVLGCGLACVYPPENAGVARDIARCGALVSEFPMLAEPLPGSFPRRNRVIAGLSVGVVVVEAASKSGALITAARGLEQGREVFAVPGPVDDPLSAGPNRLIKAGAKLTEDAGDVLDELEAAWGPFPLHRPNWSRRPAPYSEERRAYATGGPGGTGGPDDREALPRRLLSLLSLTPVTVDELVAGSGAPVAEVLSALLDLELRDEVKAAPGGTFMLGSRARVR
jgi:DNA processing protein